MEHDRDHDFDALVEPVIRMVNADEEEISLPSPELPELPAAAALEAQARQPRKGGVASGVRVLSLGE